MLSYPSGFAITCAIFLSACERQIEYVPVIPDVPAELRTPVAVPDRQAESLRDVGLILTDHVEALTTANDRISSTDCILTAAENGEEPNCGAANNTGN